MYIYYIYYKYIIYILYILYIYISSRLSPQWLCGNLCTWAHDIRLHIAGTNEPKSVQQAKQGA